MPGLQINGVEIPSPADVCIVGGGVAGALIAWKLGRAGIRTVILEVGRRYPASEAMARMQRFIAGDDPWRTDRPARDVFSNGGEIRYPLNETRVKGVGGTTLHWAAYTPRFLADDFRLQSAYGVGADWPISYEELEPYYGEAEAELGVAGAPDNPFAAPRSTPFPLPAFPIGYDDGFLVEAGTRLGIQFHTMPQARTSERYRERPACATFSACRACPIRARYSGDIHIELAEATGYVTVVAGANVVKLETDQSGRQVQRAIVATEAGATYAVSATVFVVAAHAIESARLLLLSSSPAHPDGLANSSGQVGLNFMEHCSRHKVAKLSRPLYPFRKGFQTAFSQQFHATVDRGRQAAFLLTGEPTGSDFADHVTDITSRSGLWGEAFTRELESHLREEYGRSLLIRFHPEPMPGSENRVELDPDLRDSFGNPAPRLVYSLGEYERTAYEHGHQVIDQMAEVLDAESIGPSTRHFGRHHAGTCRMGDDPATAVVDRNLKAHDLANLYVAGSSNFVTLSTVNPTLTICALALRLARHLQNGATPAAANGP